ncbi:NAD(P)-binding protein [Patellaria atrata CBS 101060]|uniref:NAD(P)-binding protein n=1 Tax=Patellaria atrata CBS 101060 TaxID=1346257 RepID=A0A9P4SEZ6_9PEZI|nr:NAD(P)-binding protein [Patellaria atrata CBS 101060]
MPYELKGRNVLVTAGSRGLGAAIALKFAREGANVAINYYSRVDAAEDVARKIKAECEGVKTVVIQGDCGVMADCRKCVQETIRAFGGIDIIIGNAGWTRFSNFTDLDALSDDEWDKCWNTNVKGQLALLREALPTLNQNPDGGAMIVTSSIAGVSAKGSSMAYSVTKAAQIQLMKCLARAAAPKVRVNAVLPGLLLTEWGMRYSEERVNALKAEALLQHETFIDDCADAYIMLAKNTSMTATKIQVDAGICIGNP